MDIQDIKKRYEDAYIEDFGDYEIVHADKREMNWLIEQVEEFERYKKYVLYFAGKDKVNDIRLAMRDRELD